MKTGLPPAILDIFALIIVMFLLIPHREELKGEDDAKVGDLVIEIAWCDRCQTDVDLWVRSPGDIPVGYSRLRGRYISLMRDDLGDGPERWRGEIASSRTIPDGEWIVNLHAFSDSGNNLPLEITVNIWYRKNGERERTTIWSGKHWLNRNGEEITVVRWKMANGLFVPGSIHHSPVTLRLNA